MDDVSEIGISSEFAAHIINYAEEVLGIVEKLKEGIKLLGSMNVGASMKQLATAIKADTQADAMRRDILLTLTEVRGGYIRERIARLVRRLDLVSEQTKEAARDLTLIPYLELPGELKEVINELTEEVYGSVRSLLEALTALMKGESDRAIEASRGVEELEEEADKTFLRGKKLLIKYGEKISNPAVVLMLFNFLQSLENVTDYAEDAGDYIRTLAIREKSEGGTH